MLYIKNRAKKCVKLSIVVFYKSVCPVIFCFFLDFVVFPFKTKNYRRIYNSFLVNCCCCSSNSRRSVVYFISKEAGIASKLIVYTISV